MKKRITLGLLVGNRSFFPSHLIKSGRETVLKVLEEEGIDIITLSEKDTLHAGISDYHEAQKCADLFKSHQEEIDGILITLPNFGDERSAATAIRLSGLQVPILVHAFNDDANLMTVSNRRDSFCGKMSVCNNLKQYGIRFTLPEMHTSDPASPSFRADLQKFAATCRVVRGLRGARIGALGARPQAFTTVRFSEKLLEANGISVETLDLSEAFGRAQKINEDDPVFKAKLEEMHSYLVIKNVPDLSLIRMAKLALVVDEWMKNNGLVASAIQCWTSIEQHYGITPCTLMSMMSNNLMPSACETDVMGALAMYAMVLASGKASALLDWNNNYGDDPDKTIMFHCSNLPKDIFVEKPEMTFSEIIAEDVGLENAYGTVSGRIKAQPFTYCRLSTDDLNAKIKAYVGEGEFTEDEITTFGGYGVAYVKDLQQLLRFACLNGFEHHVAVNPSRVAPAIYEAFTNYFEWDVYYHH